MNYFKFSKYTIATIIVFCLAFLCIMFNTLLVYLIIPALLLLATGTLMIAIKLIKKYKSKKDDYAFNQEEIIMELASTEDGEKYIAEKGSYIKKMKRRLRGAKWDMLIPIIFSLIASALFIGLLIKYVIGLF